MSNYLHTAEAYQHLCENALTSKLIEIIGDYDTVDFIIKGGCDAIKMISNRINLLEHKLKWRHPFWKKKNPGARADINAYKENIKHLEKKLEPYNEQKIELSNIKLSVWRAILKKVINQEV